MCTQKSLRGIGNAAFGLGLALVLAVAVAPQRSVAQATVTQVPFSANIFVPCADGGSGEFVGLQFTLILVERNDDNAAPELGVWANASGVGLTTGATYRGTVVSTRIPGSEEYITNVSMSSGGRDGAHFTLTRIGPLFQPPTEVIQVHCS